MKLTKNLLKFANKHAGASAAVITVLSLALIIGISWISTCGVVYLVCACFGWTFTWPIATGIWLLTCLARSIFRNTTTVKK